ncbi:protein kinase [Streptomyces scabiei]|uniref:serine/threonine-protein kinase n=1 Tax=Streptomyces scabiei TaxID=1930 RepID=UPI001B30EECA|nr:MULTISPECIES: serine/threonine-protein kinase [Streptomyces]MBP5860957.1 protein kinase [Streptomyces sp. LBUM 1484]MBP5878630.1 protein kinase [Streptomyces sp. LBUM 1477]MBP5886467.1 protein kinase [Streptomyces sp. LBUM 1487]MBP5902454.1 protein kinase [Streptomyces sp. LBUM 1488]MDW8476047.1 protein kinase [Streptomyces scabiei]
MNNTTEVFQPLQADDPAQVAGFRLAARLGAGGMGRVYLSHTQGGRPVAIKVVRPELADDPAFRRRFGREIKAARRVRGAYTAELIDADADGVPPWLATLYVPGPSLAEAVGRRGPLPVPAVLWLMAGVAEALQAIHDEGIVHRDLKPSNVLLAADGPRVIDFGVSLAADLTSNTATGTAVGTPQFMAPEQATGGEVTAATDVFALGQTAAFAALGEPLYGDGPSVSVLYRIVHERPDLSVLPERLRPMMARCLAVDPAERPTPAEVVAWSRGRLGRDADTGGGPAVWREVTGPEVTVPPPAAADLPTVAHARPSPSPTHPLGPGGPMVLNGPMGTTGPYGPTRPAGPGRQRARRRPTALIAAVAVTGGALLLSGLVWTVTEGVDRFRERVTTTSSSSASGKGTSGNAGAEGADGEGREKARGSKGAKGTDVGTPEASTPSPSEPAQPRAIAYPLQFLNEKNSLDIRAPQYENVREDRKGDIRFTCARGNCALESDSTVITMIFGEPGAGLETCRVALTGATSHRFTLSAAAAGSEFCFKTPDGDIALYVVQVKSTALPDSGASFVTGDMTVWRAK